MIDEQIAYNSIKPLRNVSALWRLIEQLKHRKYGLPGLGTFYGFSGYGKTCAACHAVVASNDIHVRMGSTWTQAKLCKAILIELGVAPRRTISDMVDQIAEELARTGRALLIDEADFLVKRNMVEIVRDVHDQSDGVIVLIGEEKLPQALQRWERVHGRILQWVAAEPGDIGDLRLLASLHTPEIELEEVLLARILRDTRGSIRRMCNSLDAVSEFASTKALDIVTSEDWGERSFFTGEAPAPRRSA